MADEAKRKTSLNEFVKQVKAETGKIVWPTRQETTTTAIFVGILILILSVFFLSVDFSFSSLVAWLLSLA